MRQPWYPVQERYGLIFAYMGPAEKKPVLPRYECLEKMDDGEFVEADDTSIGGGGPAVIPCNWLQHFENVVDPYHVPVLHGSFSGPQFTNMMASMPEVKFEMSPRGVTVRSIRHQDDGKVFYRVTEAALPTLRVVPNPRVAQFARVESIGWTLPIDDTSFRIYVAGRVKKSGDIGRMRSKFNGKFWWDMTEQEHQQFPGDYEAQVGQGPVTLHSEEHFGQSDRGILMIRRMLSDQLEAMAAGRDPDRRLLRSGRAAGRIRGGEFHSRGVSSALRPENNQGETMVDLAPQAAAPADAAARPSDPALLRAGMLTVVYALNFLDRTIFNVLIEPIKKEFTLSDTTMGLLAGFGFVLFYSLLGIPIARVADRLNRRNIVAIAFAFWSAMTFLCGMATSVTTLALARIGVGIGESAGTPASQSMVADLFNKNERPRALGIYAIGTYLGVFLGYFIGG